MRIALLSFRGDTFAALHAACVDSGHLPVVAVHERIHGRWAPFYPEVGEMVSDMVTGIPDGLDLMLPSTPDGLVHALRGYRPDLLVVCGCSWRLPQPVLETPRLGVLNIHPSLLPRYRGPAPLEWAIRNGDPTVGLTAHWMSERIDAGDIIVQRDGPPIPEFPTYDTLWRELAPAIRALTAEALLRVGEGCTGEAQNDELATYAGVMEPAYAYVDWAQPARAIHNQVRTFHFSGAGPIAHLDGQRVHILRTSLSPGHGRRIACGDGPIWIAETRPATGPPT